MSDHYNPFARKFQDDEEIVLDLDHVIDNLRRSDYRKVKGFQVGEDFEKWQQAKEDSVHAELDSGKEPSEYDPIDIRIPAKRDKYHVIDGISRIRAFSKRVKEINAKLRHTSGY